MKRIGRWILAALAIALLIGAALAENAGEALPGRTGEATAEISPMQAGDAAPSQHRGGSMATGGKRCAFRRARHLRP